MKKMSDNDIVIVLRNGLENNVPVNFWREFLRNVGRKRLKEFNINQYFVKDDVVIIASKMSRVLNKDYNSLFSFGVRLFTEWRPWLDSEATYERLDRIVELRLKDYKK